MSTIILRVEAEEIWQQLPPMSEMPGEEIDVFVTFPINRPLRGNYGWKETIRFKKYRVKGIAVMWVWDGERNKVKLVG